MSELILSTDTPNDGREKINENIAHLQNAKGQGAPTNGSDAFVSLQTSLLSAAEDLTMRTHYIPPGDYYINSKTGTGRGIHSLLLENTSGVRIVGDEGTRLLFGPGAHSRPLIVRNCENILIEGIELVWQGAVKSGVGINIENSSGITVRDCRIKNFGVYGIGATEDSSAWLYSSSTISFNGAYQEIYDSAGGLLGPLPGDRILIVGSLYNNGYCSYVGGSATAMTVTQAQVDDIVLVDEAAGESGASLVNDGVEFFGSTLTVTDGTLYFLKLSDWIRITGSQLNDGDYQLSPVAAIDPDGQSLTITGTFITENSSGQDVTIQKIGRPTIRVMRAAPCDDLLIENNTVSYAGVIGLELFPKKKSNNLKVLANTIDHSGLFNTAGTGIKAGQFTYNALISDNEISYGQMGMNIGNWDSSRYTNNLITNCQKYGIAITISDHALMPVAPFGTLAITGNTIAFTDDETTGVRFVPTRPHNPAVNINGLVRPNGPVEIAYNTIYKWGADAVSGAGRGGIQINKSVMDMRYLHIHHNTVFDSGGFGVFPLENYTAELQAGGTTLLNVMYDRPDVPTAEPPLVFPPKATTAGWYVGSVVAHPLIPPGTTITAIDSGENRMTMSNPAIGALVGAKLRSGYPKDLRVENNRFWSSADSSVVFVRFYTDGGRLIGNTLRHFGEYAIQLNGTEVWAEDNVIIEPNVGGSTNRGPFITGTANENTGIYHINSNRLDLGKTGMASYLVNSTNAGTLYMSRNETNSYLAATISGGVQPSLLTWLEGGRPAGMAYAAPTGAAPNGGNWAAGTVLRNATASPVTCPIEGWRCVAAGSPGTWVSFGGVGIGTTTQANALVTAGTLGVSEKLFFINTTTNQLWLWNGTAWKNVATLT